MSESSFPFKGQAVADAPASDVTDVTEAQSNRTTAILAAGLAGIVVLAVVVYLLFFSGGGDSAATAPTPKPDAAGPVEPAVEAAAPAVKQRISAKSFGRDPFEARIVAADTSAAAPGVPSIVGGDTTITTDSGPTAPVVGVTTPTTTDEPPTSTGPAAPTSSRAHSFRVVSVAADNSSVDVKVDGKLYKKLRGGEVFATLFKVRVIGGEVNQFQVGDERFRVQGMETVTVAG